MSQTIIRFETVSKHYQDQVVLNQLSFAIAAGEFISIIGQSGCGKTSILKLMNGLIEPTAGHIIMNDQDIKQTDKIMLRRQIGYVIQGATLFPHLTVLQNLNYVTTLSQKISKDKQLQDGKAMLQLLGMNETLLERFPYELSGGQQQRIGIGRALLAQPQVVLMDEPFSAVDEITRQQLQQEMKQIHQRLKTTFILVTHSINEALRLSDRIMVIETGEIAQFASPKELIEQPKTPFIAQLVAGATL